ncbi:MAG TPA: menaquinone biosynthesis decarboxylase [Dehalococcoidia bacterium]|nr:menaquinone biosynthesis decarboxylase [Dehalococcoidia bacterium]
MALHSFRDYLQLLEQQGELRRVRVEVDPVLEVSEIAQRVVREAGPALLFENVRGSRHPLAINFFGSERRIELALGRHPGEFGSGLIELLERLNPPTPRALWSAKGELPRLLAARVRTRATGPCREIEERPSLHSLPVIQCWPKDAGRFITYPLVLTHHPQTRRRNLGLYRMQLFDECSTGMHWQIQKGGGFHYAQAELLGRSLPVAVALGADPATMIAAVVPLPEDIDELAFAGFLRGSPVTLARGRSIPVAAPAEAEFVLEGVVPAGERREEGPFGDHFGHYSAAAPFPVFHVRGLTRRRNAVFPAAVVGKPPQEDTYLGNATQELTGPLIRLLMPEVTGVWAYYEAGFHNLLAAAVHTRYPKEAMKSAMGLLGQGQLSLTKCLILVDAGVDVRDFRAVLRQIALHVDPRDDFVLIPNAPLDTLDFTSFKMHLGSKMIIDATSPRYRSAPVDDEGGSVEPGPSSEAMAAAQIDRLPADLRSQVDGWALHEDTLLAVRTCGDHGRDLLRALLAVSDSLSPKLLAVVSGDVDVTDRVQLIWGIFTRFDPGRDVLFPSSRFVGSWPIHEGQLGIDATWKPGYPEPLEMSQEIRDLVDRRWQEYWRT